MEYTITEIKDKSSWESFILSCDETPFFQSWAWGEVQRSIGYPVLRLGLIEGKNLKGIVQIIKVIAKRGQYYHLRHGPLLKSWDWKQFDVLMEEIKKKAIEEQVLFVRTSPLIADTRESLDKLRLRGFRDSPIHNMDGEIAWVLDIDRPDEELLSKMRKTTRYLIKKAIKLGVEVQERKDDSSLRDFLNLYKETALRQQFIPHKGIEEEWKIFRREHHLKLYFATFRGKLLSAAMIVSYGKQAVYHHSASVRDQSDIPASYLLQWEAIREARKQGLKRYNFWGVAPPNKNNHPWKGLSLFKMGFGGRMVTFIHTQDFALKPGYIKIYLLETFFRLKRGY